MRPPSRFGVWSLLGLVMMVAAFCRVWRLDAVPPGPWPDEALNGVQALEAMVL